MTLYSSAQPRDWPRVSKGRRRFDIITIGLHWVTVALIVGMFASAGFTAQTAQTAQCGTCAQCAGTRFTAHTGTQPYRGVPVVPRVPVCLHCSWALYKRLLQSG
jgi:hypothetical protein